MATNIRKGVAMRLLCAGVCLLPLLLSACSSVGERPLPSPEEVMAQQRGPIQRGEYRLMVGDKLNVKAEDKDE